MDENLKPIRVPHDTLQTHEKFGERRPRLVQVGSNYTESDAIPVNRFMDYRVAVHHIIETKRPTSMEEVRDLTQKLFGELEMRGILVAAQNVIAMKDAVDRDAVFVSAKDVIPGGDANSLQGEQLIEYARAMTDVWRKLHAYYRDKATTGEPFLWDIFRHEQYVWGKTKGDALNRMYLVDVDPHIGDEYELLARSFARLALEIESFMTSTFRDMPELGLRELASEVRKSEQG